jgi:hypothetical protein
MMRTVTYALVAVAALLALAAAGNYGAGLYYAAGHGDACADCHEMTANVGLFHASPHHDATCTDCHEAGVEAKMRHVRDHVRGHVPEQIRLREADVRAMVVRCQRCHQAEYASWHAGPHAATYGEIFTSASHNAKRRMNDDCLRCHGMFYEGAVRDLVQPQNTAGPWHLANAALAGEPSLPCQGCHAIHASGSSQSRSEHPSLAESTTQSSLAFYDRREERHFRSGSLPLPQVFDGARAIRISTDPRQGLCYQCHAPRIPETTTIAAQNHWGPQAGSGDDRTPKGVHEGLSCLACHNGHNQSARASCAGCHGANSSCGINVQKMDTTFANPRSPHNIHWVKCDDCHEKGVPRRKSSQMAAGQ